MSRVSASTCVAKGIKWNVGEMLKIKARLISARVMRAKTLPPSLGRLPQSYAFAKSSVIYLTSLCTTSSAPLFRPRSLALSTSTSTAVTPFRLAPGFRH